MVGHPIVAMLGLTVLFEGLTCWGRFVHGLQSTRDTGCVGHWTRGLRIHHCYIGGAMLGASLCFADATSSVMTCVGAALVLSDLVHHFVVLWPVTGNHAFDLKYPARDR